MSELSEAYEELSRIQERIKDLETGLAHGTVVYTLQGYDYIIETRIDEVLDYGAISTEDSSWVGPDEWFRSMEEAKVGFLASLKDREHELVELQNLYTRLLADIREKIREHS